MKYVLPVAKDYLVTSLVSRNLSNWEALEYSKLPNWCRHFLISSIQHSLLEPTVHRVMGSPHTTSHSLARVTAVLKSCSAWSKWEQVLYQHTHLPYFGVGKEACIFFQVPIISGIAGSDSRQKESTELFALHIIHSEYWDLYSTHPLNTTVIISVDLHTWPSRSFLSKCLILVTCFW